VEVEEGDLRDPEACRSACRGVRLVFHQAALGSVPRSLADPATTFAVNLAVNLAGTANLLAAAREAGAVRVVYASSSSVYGDSEVLPRREGEEGEALSPYAQSKQLAEEVAAGFGRFFGLEVVGLRYFNVYGPRQSPAGPYAAVIPRFLAAYAAGRPPEIHGDGSQSRDFTYVADVVEANLLAAAAPAAACGRAYNVGSGRTTTVADLARLLKDLAGGGPEPLLGPPRPGDVMHSHADLGDAGRVLGYRPAWSLEEGLRETAAWFASQPVEKRRG
jgi:nucleoside-diphosphate-sugar epimerase